MSGGLSPYYSMGAQMPQQSGFGSPSMQGYGFNWYGGQPLVPEGGYYNQMAQMMAGPSYAPQGTNWYSGAPTADIQPRSPVGPSRGPQIRPQSPAFGGKGASPMMGVPTSVFGGGIY